MQKNECIKFVEGVNFGLIDSLKKNRTKYLLIFEDSCEEVCNSKESVKIATAGRHRGLTTIHNNHTLFHKSTLGPDIELKTTHIALFKSPRDVTQINTFSIQLGLGSSLVDWYRDATSVPFSHLLINLSLRTDNRLRFCTNSGKTPSKFYVPESVKHLTTLDNEHTKSLYSPRVPTISPQVQNSISRIVSKRIYSVSKRVHRKPTQRKLAWKRHHIYNRTLSLERTTWKQRRDLVTSERVIQLVDTITPFVINHLS